MRRAVGRKRTAAAAAQEEPAGFVFDDEDEARALDAGLEPADEPHGLPPDADVADDEAAEPRADVPMSVVWQKQATSTRLGAAWLVGDEIHCAELEEQAPQFEQLKLLKMNVDPSVLIAPSASDVRLLEQLALDPATGAPEHFLVQLLKPLDTTVEAARRALSFLRTADCPAGLPNEHLASWHYAKLPEDGAMLRAVGALLTTLARNGEVSVLRIVPRTVGKNMVLDACALHSLAIFRQHLHPSTYGGRAKEGLSLFALMNRTVSKVGERQLRHWFAAPTFDQGILEARLDAVAFFRGAASTDLFSHVREALKGAKDVARAIVRVRGGCRVADLHEISSHCAAHRRAHTLLAAQSDAVEEHGIALPHLLQRFVAADDVAASLGGVAQLLSAFVNFAASALDPSRVVINEGIDAERDRLQGQLDSLQDLLDAASDIERDATVWALVEAGLLPPRATPASEHALCALVREITATYVPQLGFFCEVPAKLLGALAELPDELRPEFVVGHDSFASPSTETVYCKSKTATHLDGTLGDLASQIADRDLAVVRQLEERLLEKTDKLLLSLDLLAELDALCALAQAATDLRFCRPTLTERRALELDGAWHPIVAERVPDGFIPNGLALGGEGEEAIMVLTGPNGSGKSVYLKMVAIVVFLAHVGSFVPARAATIGLTDRVQVRIFSRETAAVAKSSFMLDLHQAALMLATSTERTLLVLDELGKGTHFADGLAFLASFVRSLAARGRACPLLLVATHFTELLDLPEMADVRMQHKTMQALVEPAAADAPESVLLLYKVIDGRCSHSFATSVARAVGVPECIVARAEAIQELVKRKQPISALADDARARSTKIVRVLEELRALNINSKEAVAGFLAGLARP